MQIPRNNYVQTTLLSTPCVGWCACDTTQLEAKDAGAYQDVRARYEPPVSPRTQAACYSRWYSRYFCALALEVQARVSLVTRLRA